MPRRRASETVKIRPSSLLQFEEEPDKLFHYINAAALTAIYPDAGRGTGRTKTRTRYDRLRR